MTEQFEKEEQLDEDQIEQEQFVEESSDEPSGKVRQYFMKKKMFEKKKTASEQRHYEMLKRKEEKKHKATFTRFENQNGYICDNCGKAYPQEKGALMYKPTGEYAYCNECLKVLYPDYKHIKLAGTINKLDYCSNHYDVRYFSCIK